MIIVQIFMNLTSCENSYEQSSLIVQRLICDLCIYCAIYMSNIPQKCFCSKRLTLLWSSIESFYIPVLKKLLAHLEIHCPISRFRLFWYKLRTVWNLRYISEGSDDLEQNSYCMNFKTYLIRTNFRADKFFGAFSRRTSICAKLR